MRLGACGLAPAVVFDGEVAGKVTAAKVKEKIAAFAVPELEPAGVGA